MERAEILKEIKGKDSIVLNFKNGSEELFFKNSDGLWLRKCWGVSAYLTDEEFAAEIEEDYADELEFIM